MKQDVLLVGEIYETRISLEKNCVRTHQRCQLTDRLYVFCWYIMEIHKLIRREGGR